MPRNRLVVTVAMLLLAARADAAQSRVNVAYEGSAAGFSTGPLKEYYFRRVRPDPA
jgi:hypothetical protein